MNETTQSIKIVGAGTVGTSLAVLFEKQGHTVQLVTRDIDATQSRLKQHLQSITLIQSNQIARSDSPCIYILAVSDSAIRECCEKLAPYLNSHDVVTHLSGALSSQELEAAIESGASIASTHPLNTFPNLEAGLRLLGNNDHNTPLFCEGMPAALERLKPLFTSVGFEYQTVSASSKVLYHAACVMACNYLNSLIDASTELAANAEVDKDTFAKALMPILRATLNNIEQQGVVSALSGPIARGDSQMITKHRLAISGLNDGSTRQVFNAYDALGQHTVDMLARAEFLAPETILDLKRAFDTDSDS